MLTAFAIFSDGLVYAAYLFLVAVGLTLIFGVMKILNVTHGSFYAFGAYGAATAAGVWYDRGLNDAGGLLFMVGLAMLIGLVIGIILERGILRFVYGRDEVVVVLVTYAVFLILEDVIVLIWGPRSYTAYQPMVAAGSIDIGDLTLSNYDIGLVVLAGGARRVLLLGAEIHPLRPAAHGGDLRPRDCGRLRRQRHASSTPSPSSSARCWARLAAR